MHGRDVGAAIPARARSTARAGGRGGSRSGHWTLRSPLSAAGLQGSREVRGRNRISPRSHARTPHLQSQAPPRAGDCGVWLTELDFPFNAPRHPDPEPVHALSACVCSWKRGQLGSGLCARGLSPSLGQLPFILAPPTLACFPFKRKNY